MANRNHLLDEKITSAAKAEFLSNGYGKASLRKIAEKAGITTGALYTRYKNKDVLFKSLISSALGEIAQNYEGLNNNYLSFADSPCVEKMMDAIKKEEKLYLDIMFRYYDECRLFLCMSDGSSLQEDLQVMMSKKAKETVKFLHSIAKCDFDSDGVEFILSMQFYYYRQILQRGYTKEKAMVCMKTVENFLEAGWRDLFEKIL